ncbi:hypothetical protein V6N13_032352 [Hibiscus sabdariffa]
MRCCHSAAKPCMHGRHDHMGRRAIRKLVELTSATLMELSRASTSLNFAGDIRHQRIPGHWLPPDESWIKVNTNGARSETMGVYIGLMAVWDCGFRYVVLEVDNIEVYQAICAEQYTAKAGSLAWHIKTLMQGEWEVRVQHVLREGIGAADTLAKLAYKSSTSVIWFEEPPSIILHVLMKDVNCLD